MTDGANVKAIIVDLDRTLLRTDKTISPYTLGVLEACRRRGMKIMAATARPWRTARQYGDMLAMDAMVVSNGARVICGHQRLDDGIPLESALRLLRALKRYPDMRITLETGDCAYANHPIEDYETILTDDLAAAAEKEGVIKLLVHLDHSDTRSLVENELTDDLYATVAHGYLMQIMSKSTTKWHGICTMLALCGCTPDEAAYFGDDQDDLEPIRLCGVGVAVGNAIDEVKAAADDVAASNDEDGVARYIERHFLRQTNM